MTEQQITQSWQAGRDFLRAELARIIAREPDYMPYGCQPIQAGSFAAACYDDNSLSDLDLSVASTVDTTDCEQWGLTPQGWAEQIGMAYEANIWNREHGLSRRAA